MILTFHKQLTQCAPVPDFEGLTFRPFRGAEDANHWLRIHNRAYSALVTGGRDWGLDDFRREFLAKPGWSEDDIWFADSDLERRPVGTVACTSSPKDSRVYHLRWLGVCPRWQRRGIGRALVSTAERRCWKNRGDTLRLETLSDWVGAVALYESLGYCSSSLLRGA